MSIVIGPTTRIAVLTGAGISAESGISTFRDAGGLWEKHRFEDVASPEAWKADPALVWRFYSERRVQAASCAPNAAHKALAKLEAKMGERLFLVTQNVDALHEASGSREVLHMHGELFKSRCENDACGSKPFLDIATYFKATELPKCSTCGSTVRPHIVWFGEEPFEMHRIKRAVQASDIFITIGSSGSVYPAAGLVGEMTYRKQNGEKVRSVYVGPEAPQNSAEFDEILLGKAGDVLPTLFEIRE